ncbi:MAG TPA: cytochrome D1 domain-containing protein [Anaeromyxobacteraceae bacterium]|nr:cytochrome D1 domain-containing protein [Anaeromyxobacteraceae bacterium]
MVAATGPAQAAAAETSAPAPASNVPAATSPAPAAESPGRVVRDGVVVDFSLRRAGETSATPAPLLEGDYAEIRFSMTDAASGKPVPGLKPAAWLDMANVVAGRAGEQRECKEKIGLYLKGVVGIRPMVDLNSYYLLLLNQDPSISVIDPVVSMTGNTSLYATVVLKRPGADWARGADDKRLYVSMPKAGEVAVVDAEAFKVLESIPAGERPTRVAIQPDGRYLWVGNDAASARDSGVTVIDLATSKVAGTVATGRGHHELAFSPDSRHAFVTNRESGTVTVVDVAKLAKVKDLEVGGVPISIATSPLSRTVYVAEAKRGQVLAIDPATLQVTARIAAAPGLGPMRFSQDGRWGLVVNPAENAVYAIDAAANKVAHVIPVGGKPYQVSFTRAFAYVRLLDSEQVKLVNLLSLAEGKKPTVQSFGAGTGAPMAAGELGLADSISPASTEAAVFVVNPADGNSYFYMEGMNSPMGSYGSYGHRVQAVGVVDRSLKEVSPGVYTGKLRLPAAGHYDVAFLLDNPRVLHCFGADAAANPALAQKAGLSVEFLDLPWQVASARPLEVRFRLTDARTREPRTGLGDVLVSSYAVPGRDRRQTFAREEGQGIYRATVPLQAAGVYYVFVSVASIHVAANEVPFRTIQVAAPAAGPQKEGAHARNAP